MKKSYMAVAIALAMSTMITGCSASKVPSVKEMFVGKGSMDYDPVECVSIGEYKGIEVDCTVSDDEVQAEINNLLESNKVSVKKGTCKIGDIVNIDYTAKKNGKKFDSGSAEDQTITLGSSNMISIVEKFDDSVAGMKVGEKKTVKLKYNKEHPDKKLAGKEVSFTIKLNYISKNPEFDDKFVEKNTDYKTVDEFKQETKKKISASKKESAGYTAFDTLLGTVKVTTEPESLKQKWEKIISNDLDYQAKQSGVDAETMLSYYGMDKETYLKESVANQLKQVLAVEAIAEQEEIEITEQNIKDEIKTACTQTGQDENAYRKSFDEYYQGVQTLEQFIEFNLKAKNVLEILKSNAKIKE